LDQPRGVFQGGELIVAEQGDWISADYFRSSPGNGHRQGRSACLKSAKSGRAHTMLPWASGWREAERHNQESRAIDPRMDDDADRRIPRALYGPRYGEHDRQEEKQDAKAETEVKEAMKKSLDEPGAPTEYRLLARLDEPAPPEFLADNVKYKERQPERKNVVLTNL
jgi:hypothetical protein